MENKEEGYKSEILSTSTNNPPINNFLVELDKDTKEVQGTFPHLAKVAIFTTNANAEN